QGRSDSFRCGTRGSNYDLVQSRGESIHISASEHIPQHEPQVCGTLCQPPHEIGIPIPAIRNIDSHPIAVLHKFLLKVAPYAVQHLKLKLVRPYPLVFRKLPGWLNHLLVVSRYSVINARRKQHSHELDVVFIDVGFLWKCDP